MKNRPKSGSYLESISALQRNPGQILDLTFGGASPSPWQPSAEQAEFVQGLDEKRPLKAEFNKLKRLRQSQTKAQVSGEPADHEMDPKDHESLSQLS